MVFLFLKFEKPDDTSYKPCATDGKSSNKILILIMYFLDKTPFIKISKNKKKFYQLITVDDEAH